MAQLRELTNFSHESPFDLLSLITLSLSLNEINYTPDNSRVLRLCREVRENLKDGLLSVSQVLAYKNGRFKF